MTKIEIGPDGVQIDAGIIAKALKLAPLDLQQRMREGTVTSRFERGEGDDAGRVRLTFFSGTRRARITADAAGEVLSCTAVDYTGPPRSPSSASKSTAKSASKKRSPDRDRLDALLDTALEGSFPASDPTAISFDRPE